MSRKQFATSIDTDVANRFRNSCDKRGIKMNVVLEAFMNQFADDEFQVKITKSVPPTKVENRHPSHLKTCLKYIIFYRTFRTNSSHFSKEQIEP